MRPLTQQLTLRLRLADNAPVNASDAASIFNTQGASHVRPIWS
jgi:hypothetical protein